MSHINYAIEGLYKNRSTGKREWKVWQRDLDTEENARAYYASGMKRASVHSDGGYSDLRIVEVTYKVIN